MGAISIEKPCGLCCAGLLLACRTVFVHGLPTDAVALGHLLGRLQHAPINGGLLAQKFRVLNHVLIDLLLHARDALDATGHIHMALTGNDALRRQRDGLQAR